MEDKGGVGIVLVAVIASALCVAAATAASESSSLTEALGPKLEPLDPVTVWGSPRVPSGARVPSLARLAWLGLALSPPRVPSGPRVPSLTRLA